MTTYTIRNKSNEYYAGENVDNEPYFSATDKPVQFKKKSEADLHRKAIALYREISYTQFTIVKNEEPTVIQLDTTLVQAVSRHFSKRLEALEKATGGNVPAVIEESLKKAAANPLKAVAKLKNYAHLQVSAVEHKTGRGGKGYYSFNTDEGVINFFPDGQYGAFVAPAEDK